MKTELPDIIRLLLMSFNTVVIMYSLSKLAELRTGSTSIRSQNRQPRKQQSRSSRTKRSPKQQSAVQNKTIAERSETKITPKTTPPKTEATSEISFSAPAKKPVHKSDAHDLTRIQGIGPKSEQILKRAGINTYADLARRSPSSIKKILVEYDVRYGMYDVTSWPKQAKLAHAGEWEHLKQLKRRLGPRGV